MLAILLYVVWCSLPYFPSRHLSTEILHLLQIVSAKYYCNVSVVAHKVCFFVFIFEPTFDIGILTLWRGYCVWGISSDNKAKTKDIQFKNLDDCLYCFTGDSRINQHVNLLRLYMYILILLNTPILYHCFRYNISFINMQ